MSVYGFKPGPTHGRVIPQLTLCFLAVWVMERRYRIVVDLDIVMAPKHDGPDGGRDFEIQAQTCCEEPGMILSRRSSCVVLADERLRLSAQ